MNKATLQSMPIFAFCCMQHAVYGKKLRYETYKRAQILCAQNDAIEAFGFVVNGLLRAEKYTMQGSALCCGYFENNDVFPELLYYTGKRVYTYTLVAVQKTTVAWMQISDMEEILKNDADLSYAFMLYLSKRGMKNQMLLSCLEYQTIRERIAYWLINIHHLSQYDKIALPRSQSMWANTLHVSRSSLNQELKHMETDGLIERRNQYLIVLDQKRLEMLL